jgi:hypothetical protein
VGFKLLGILWNLSFSLFVLLSALPKLTAMRAGGEYAGGVLKR